MTTQLDRNAIAVGDERRSLGYLGMVIFLGSWVMMFGALFFTYGLLRAGANAWPTPGTTRLPLLLPGISTIMIAISSGTLQLGVHRLRQGRAESFAPWLFVTIVVGFAFLALQAHVWQSLWEQGLRPSSGTYGSVFYLMTVFHFLHVVVGLGLLLWRVPAALRRSARTADRVPVKLISMFWHFVTIVWLAIYVTVYVL